MSPWVSRSVVRRRIDSATEEESARMNDNEVMADGARAIEVIAADLGLVF
jgi:hypothetical protein